MTQAPHHTNSREATPGIWQVAKPLRDTSPWHRWRQESACRKATGHCWHPEDLIGWFCCECAAETDGMPAQECVHCVGVR